jgi:hypothetical protein
MPKNSRIPLHFGVVLFINTATGSFVAGIKAVAQTTILCCYVDTGWIPM